MKFPNKVSVVICTYNRPEKLSRAIESVLSQTYADCELVIIDDGSTDKTRSVVESFGRKRNLRYVYQAHEGLGEARNAGVINARGEYVLFLDDDDVLFPQALQDAVAVLKGNPDCAVAYSRVVEVDEAGRELHRRRETTLPSGDIYEEIIAGRVPCLNGAFVARKSSLLDVPYDSALEHGEDVDFACRFAERAKFAVVNTPMLRYTRYRSRHHSVSGRKYDVETIQCRYEKIFRSPRFRSARKDFQRDVWSKFHIQMGRAYSLKGNYRRACEHLMNSMLLVPTRGVTYRDLMVAVFNWMGFLR